MEIIHDLNSLPELTGTVVTDGMFDGVHLGHRKLLDQVTSIAGAMKLHSVLLTYWPHPRQVLGGPENRVSLLCSLHEKSSLIGAAGIDYMVVIPFSKAFSQMSHSVFVQDVLVNSLKTRHLIVGYDHRFGKDRLGDINYLKMAGTEHGFGITEISRQEVEAIAVSSSRIRTALEQSLPEKAAQLLGRNYSLEGVVIKGDQRGRTIGFPTANLQVNEPTKLIPGKGVYATACRVYGKSYPSMTNIGVRPTVGGSSLSIETHLLNFEGDLYGKEMELTFLSFLRDEQKFSGLAALKDQLAKDQTASLEIHQKFSDFH